MWWNSLIRHREDNCATVELLVELLKVYFTDSDVKSGSSVSRISHSIDTQLLHPVHLFLIWAPWAKWLETQNYHSSILQNNPLHADIYSIDEKVFEFVTKSCRADTKPEQTVSGEFSVCIRLCAAHLSALWVQSRPRRLKHTHCHLFFDAFGL